MRYGRLVVTNEMMKELLGFWWDTSAKIVDANVDEGGRVNFIVKSDAIVSKGVEKFSGDIQSVPPVIPIQTLRSEWEVDDESKVSL